MRATLGFSWPLIMIFAALVFATVSVDRTEVERIAVLGELSAAQLADIKQQIDGFESPRSELAAVKAHLSALPWVQQVNVRKSWPSGIEIEVRPETVIAYWNDDAFINKAGDVLTTDLLVPGDLPHLYGPEGREFEVMTRYQQLQPMLSTHAHEINVLSYSERGSWSIETRDGIEVLLGKEDLRARVGRFLSVSERLSEGEGRPDILRMDARYANGVAVHFDSNAHNNNELELAENNKLVGDQNL